MKRLTLAAVALSAVIALGLYLNRPQPPATPSEVPTTGLTPDQPSEVPQPVKSVLAKARSATPPSKQSGDSSAVAASTTVKPGEALPLNHAIDVLVSPQSSFEQKQASWKQLRDGGKFDQLIGELQQRAASDPRTAAYPATLGQAYLQKCGTIQDVREQGILAMQADKVFDTALDLDPSNWEARFTKAVALSYWPANMNKGQEVIGHFVTLVHQQETQSPQPQFAETYLWLGDQYVKTGQNEDARAAWQRGAALFPGHEALKSRLAPAQ